MKKSLLLVAAVALSFFVKAQSSFSVTELISGAAAAHNYVFTTDTSNHTSPTELLEFRITNTSASAKKIKIRKTFISIKSGHDVYFCFNSTCYGSAVHYSFANLAAGATLPNGSGSYGLRTEMDHYDSVGTSVVRYTIYDSLNVSDSLNITITYNITAFSAIKNFASNVYVSNAAPNPASNVVNFTCDLGSANTEAFVKIYNALGTLVKTTSLNSSGKSTQIDVSNLEEGFYLYSIISNGKSISTKRLIIAR